MRPAIRASEGGGVAGKIGRRVRAGGPLRIKG